MTSLSALAKRVLAGADAHMTRGRPLTLQNPSELCIAVGEYPSPGEITLGRITGDGSCTRFRVQLASTTPCTSFSYDGIPSEDCDGPT